MKLPAARHALIADGKVRDYLLSLDHPIGRFKARVFLAAGYRRETWHRLRDDLLALATEVDVVPGRSDAFGQRFLGAGLLITPNGNPLQVVTIWLIRSDGDPPRFITAYPRSMR